jgi:signal transduction histidine kinase
MKVKKTRIRARILACFSAILFFPFLLIGIIFNITVTQYIRLSAANQLNISFAAVADFSEQADFFSPDDDTENEDMHNGNLEDITLASALRITHDIFASNIFFVDEEHNLLLARNPSVGMIEIIAAVHSGNLDFTSWHNQRLHTANRMYYVSTHQMPNLLYQSETIYMVIYVDVTSPMQLAVSFNAIMMVLVCIIFVLAAFAVFFLSNSITRPIEKLGAFALTIGRGDFSPNYFEFKDKELDELNMALNKSVKQLSAYDSEQRAFFQNVSHELRTPLQSIKCYAEGIAFKLMEPDDASKTILRETDRLSELVTDLLYVSKIDNIATAYTFKEVNLVNILRVCVERQQAMADKSGIKFSFDVSEEAVYCNCEHDLVSRAIDNLISNAIRYASSVITLSCHRKNGFIEMRVTDDGAGIEEELLPHIFERFFKGKGGSFGIGLSIVKSIIQQHGWQIKAENLEGAGAAFTITLPA